MGQYYRMINLDKKEVFFIGALNGAKLGEICDNNSMGLVGLLLRQSTKFGGGDYTLDKKDIFDYNKNALVGRWAGDRVTLIGDYDNSKIYDESNRYKDITRHLIKFWNKTTIEEEQYEENEFGWLKKSPIMARPDMVIQGS